MTYRCLSVGCAHRDLLRSRCDHPAAAALDVSTNWNLHPEPCPHYVPYDGRVRPGEASPEPSAPAVPPAMAESHDAEAPVKPAQLVLL